MIGEVLSSVQYVAELFDWLVVSGVRYLTELCDWLSCVWCSVRSRALLLIELCLVFST